MAHTLIDIFNNILKYNDYEIIIILDDNGNPWFSASHVAKILEYKSAKKAIQLNVPNKYKTTLSDLVDDPNEIHQNAQPHSIFINESGLYALVNNSKQKQAVGFKEWLYEEVLPSIRQTGSFILETKYKNELEKTKEELMKHKMKIQVLENNQRKEKYPEGGFIYVIRPANIDEDLLKIGKTRLRTHNTTVPDKVNVLYKVKVNNPTAVEHCIKSLLYDYRYTNNKEYYKCSLKFVVDTIEKCQYIIKGEYYCNKCKNKIKEVSRHIANEYDIDENAEHLFELLFELNYEEMDGGYRDTDGHNYVYKYLKYKSKYLDAKLKLFSINNIIK